MKTNNFYKAEGGNKWMTENEIAFLNSANEHGFTTFSNIVPTNKNEFEFYNSLFVNSYKFAFDNAKEIAKILGIKEIERGISYIDKHTFEELFNEAQKSQYIHSILHGIVIDLEHTYFCNKYYQMFH